MLTRPLLWSTCLLLAVGACHCGPRGGGAEAVVISKQGALDEMPSVVRVQLSRPLYDPSRPNAALPDPKAVVTPPVPFRTSISSPTTIDVTFAGPLAPATDYTVTLLGGVASADKKVLLAKDVVAKFRTPLNRVERVSSFLNDQLPDEDAVLPVQGAPIGHIAGLGPSQPILVQFRYAVTAAQANELLKVFIKDGQPVATALTLDPETGTKAKLTTTAGWPRDTTLTVSVAKGLGVAKKGAGPLLTDAMQSVDVHTWGSLTATVVRSGGADSCVSPKVVTIAFNNPVMCQQLIAGLRAEGSASRFKCVSDQQSRRVRVEATPALPSTAVVTLHLPPGLQDAYGETTSKSSIQFLTCKQGTAFAFQKPFTILDPGQKAQHIERVHGASALKVEGKRLTLPVLWSLLQTQQLTDQVAWTELPWWFSIPGWQRDEMAEMGDEEGDGSLESNKTPGEISEAAVTELNGAASVTIPVGGKAVAKHGKTEWQDVPVGLDQFLGGKRGLVLLRATPLSETGKAAGPAALRIVNVTDVGLTVRLSSDTMVVLAARYSDGKPIAGAKITVQTEDGVAVGGGETGPDGLASIAVTELAEVADLRKKPLLVVATKDDDEAFVWSRFVSDPNYSDSDAPSLLGQIYPDRGIYKPGEKIHLHGVVRFPSEKGFSNPAGQEATVQLFDPDGSSILSAKVTLTDYGSFSSEFDIPETAKLGNYNAQVSLGASTLSQPFMVGEFRRAEMKVGVAAPNSVALSDTLNATVQGDYYFGAPASGRDVRWSLSRSTEAYRSQTFSEASFDGSTVEEWSSSPRIETLADGTGKLDEKGAFVIAQPLELPDPVQQHEKLIVNATVEDANGQTVSSQRSVDLFASKIMIGIESKSYLLAAKKPTTIGVVTVSPDDKLAANTPVRVYTRLIGWRSVRREGPAGGNYWTSERIVAPDVDRCEGKTQANGRYECTFTPEEGGTVEIFAETQAGGHRATTAVWRWIYGDPSYSGAGEDNNKVGIYFEKKEVNADETARVAITSPFQEGYALVTVEREDILWRKAISIGTNATIDIQTQSSWAPNVHVVVTVVRGRLAESDGKADPERDKPQYAIGRRELIVKPTRAALRVALSAEHPKVEPGLKQTVTATVQELSGLPVADAEVNLWAVDEGVLSLTAYKTPDLLASMFQHREASTIGLDTRSYILGKRIFVEPVSKGNADGGGGGDENESRLRKNFNPLAVWVGSATTDAQGRVQSTFVVPDSLTTYRVMAVAATKDDHFGSGTTAFKVNKTLMMRQALPRFARPGDTLAGGVLVNQLSDKPAEVTVNIESMDEQLFKLNGPKQLKVMLNPNETKSVLFDLSVADKEGSAGIVFSASMPGHKDRVELKLPVIRVTPRESVAVSGVVASGNVASTLTLPPQAKALGLDVNVSGLPVSALEGRLREMVSYPYGCLEQRTSKILPLVAIQELADRLAMKSIPTDQIKGWVTEYVSLVPRYRCADGGFDYWPGCQFGSSTYLTAFALEGMLTVKKYGVDVPQAEIDRTIDYLKSQVKTGAKGKDMYDAHGHKAGGMMSPLRVLAEAGQSLPDVEKASFDARASLPLFARAELTRAMSTRLGAKAKSDPSVTTLLSEIGAEGKMANGALTFDAPKAGENWWAWESEQRNTALVLRALVQVDPADGRIPLLIKGLVDLNSASSYYVTSDTTQTLLGLVETIDKLKTLGEGSAATISVGGKPLATNAALGGAVKTYSVAADKLSGAIPIDIVNTGAAPVFFGAFLSYAYPATVRLPAADAGFTVARDYVGPMGGPFMVNKPEGKPPEVMVPFGDIVKVKLTIDVAAPGDLVVIEDPLPAGWEAVNTDLATSDKDAARKAGDDTNAWWFNYNRELRDDRVEWHFEHVYPGKLELSYIAKATSVGHFQAPGARAERMYAPGVNGRSAAADVVVMKLGE
jgi:uncharacterized protein YfaS (alpha-2-macroglobulin family)